MVELAGQRVKLESGEKLRASWFHVMMCLLRTLALQELKFELLTEFGELRKEDKLRQKLTMRA